MDEIHIKSDISNKGGKIIGSLNSDEATKTVFAVMVSSILHGKWSEIVRLLQFSCEIVNFPGEKGRFRCLLQS